LANKYQLDLFLFSVIQFDRSRSQIFNPQVVRT